MSGQCTYRGQQWNRPESRLRWRQLLALTPVIKLQSNDMDMNNLFAGIFSPQAWDIQATPLEVHQPDRNRSQATPLSNPAAPDAPTPTETPVVTPGGTRSGKRFRPQQKRLGFIQLGEWDEGKNYNEDPPTCLRYSVEWKVNLNGKPITTDTESNVVLASAVFWWRSLQSQLEKRVQKKLGHDSATNIEDTNVKVSCGRERGLTKHFEELGIEWSFVENQLLEWSHLLESGKKIRVDLMFNYVGAGDQSADLSSTKGGKKTRMSATQRMRAERAAQVQAEESSGQVSRWTEVYKTMRCPGPPCTQGPHCWIDPNGKKHYKLNTHYLRHLVKDVEGGFELQSQHHIPDDLRSQLYAEDHHRHERKQSTAVSSPRGMTPITINNHFPEHSQYKRSDLSIRESSNTQKGSTLDIPGHLDAALKDYSEWQQSRF